MGAVAGGLQPDHLRHHPADLGGGVELAFALAALGGEVPHEVLVGVPQQVVVLGPVAAEVQGRLVELPQQRTDPVDQFPALAELLVVVEAGEVDHALQPVGAGDGGDLLVDLLPDVLRPGQRDKVGVPAAAGHLDQPAAGLGPVGNVLHEQQHEDVVLVLRGVHPAPQRIALRPQRPVQLALLDGHGSPCGVSRGGGRVPAESAHRPRRRAIRFAEIDPRTGARPSDRVGRHAARRWERFPGETWSTCVT